MIKHIFIRGNYREDIFFDKVDMINAWNRIWLCAYATGVKLMEVNIMSNHFHIEGVFEEETSECCTHVGSPRVCDFIHYLRMSLSYYFNYRHDVHGSLGSRRYGKADVIPIEEDKGADAKDLACYIIRNTLHHGILNNYKEWPYSTYRFVYDLFDYSNCYTTDTLPDNLRAAYFPKTVKLPKNWLFTKEGMIVPDDSVFLRSFIERLFGSKQEYEKMCETVTRRELEGENHERLLGKETFKKREKTNDLEIIEFVSSITPVPIVKMSLDHKRTLIMLVHKQFLTVSLRQLSRIFSVPFGTIKYWLKVAQ